MTTVGNSTPERPSCFGNPELWGPEDEDCAGERDSDGDFIKGKEECSFFRSCGQRVQNVKFESARSGFTARVIPPSELHRRVAFQPPPTPQPTPSYRPQVTPPPQVTVEKPQPPMLSQAQPPRRWEPTVHQAVQMNYSVPAFLAVAEERHDDEHVMAYIARYALRSALKGASQGLAHIFDTTIFKRRH